MPDVLNLLPHAVGQGSPQIDYAEVASPAPVHFSDVLYVVIPDWTRDFIFPITQWEASHGSVLPSVGDPCLIVRDPRVNWRVVWWGSSTTAFAATSIAGITAGGDLSGTYPNPTVTRLPIVTSVHGTTLGPALSNGVQVPDMMLTHTFRGGLIIVYFSCHYTWGTGNSFNDFSLVYDGGAPPGISDSTYTDTSGTSGSAASTVSPHWVLTTGSGIHTLAINYATGSNGTVTAFGARRQLTVVEY